MLTQNAIVVAFLGYLALSAGLGASLGIGDREDTLPTTLGATESAAAEVAIALGVTILAPVGEEFLLRGVVFASMRESARNYMRPWTAVALRCSREALLRGAAEGRLGRGGGQRPVYGEIESRDATTPAYSAWPNQDSPPMPRSLGRVMRALQGVRRRADHSIDVA